MGSKKNRLQPPLSSSPSPCRQPTGGPPWVLIGGVAALAVLAALALYPTSASETAATANPVAASAAVESTPASTTPEVTPASAPAAPQAASPKPPPDAPLPPLPVIPNFVPRSAEVISDAYAFAARNPDVLEFVPCFCGCETAGHRGNADCFVRARNADGSVKTWETHGMGCAVCIDVAHDAAQLHRSGASVRDVRAAIEATYEPRFPRKTPTPLPQ